MPESRPLILSVPSECSYLPVIRAFVEAACRVARCDEKFTQGLTLAVHEAVSNVICHAHRGRPEARLHVEYHTSSEAIEVQIHDEGEPFDVCAAPHRDPGELRIGGRGIFLMRALVDELMCCPRSTGGNILRLVKRRRRSEPSQSDAD